MAHNNDIMKTKLAAVYGAGKHLGDMLKTFADANPGFRGNGTRKWYADKLTAHGTSYAANAHLGDLANLYWSDAAAPY